MVRDAGHEIGLHGYWHENPIDMSLEQQRDILDKTYRQLTAFCGGQATSRDGGAVVGGQQRSYRTVALIRH